LVVGAGGEGFLLLRSATLSFLVMMMIIMMIIVKTSEVGLVVVIVVNAYMLIMCHFPGGPQERAGDRENNNF